MFRPETRKKLVRRMAREMQKLLNQLDETLDNITNWDEDKAAELVPNIVEQMRQVSRDLSKVTSRSKLENITLHELTKYLPPHEADIDNNG